MTEQEKWENYNKWRFREEYRKELKKTHPDLAELYGMRNGLHSHIRELELTILDYNEEDDADEIEELKAEVEFFEKVHKHIAKECDELFEKYGVEDKCEL